MAESVRMVNTGIKNMANIAPPIPDNKKKKNIMENINDINTIRIRYDILIHPSAEYNYFYSTMQEIRK